MFGMQLPIDLSEEIFFSIGKSAVAVSATRDDIPLERLECINRQSWSSLLPPPHLEKQVEDVTDPTLSCLLNIWHQYIKFKFLAIGVTHSSLEG